MQREQGSRLRGRTERQTERTSRKADMDRKEGGRMVERTGYQAEREQRNRSM